MQMIAFLLLLRHVWRGAREMGSDETIKGLAMMSGILMIVGTVFYHRVEGWAWIDSLYFCVMLLTTVGLGDFTPTTAFSKIFTIMYALAGIGVLLAVINAAVERRSAERAEVRLRRMQGTATDASNTAAEE